SVAGLTLSAENENNGVFTTDPEGKLKATLTSTTEIKDVLVSLSINNQQPVSAQQAVTFTPDTADYHIEGKLKVDPPGPLSANSSAGYTFTAMVLDKHRNPARNQKITQVNWSKDKSVAGLTLIAENENNGVFTTDPEGKLKATLTSTTEIKDVLVSLSIDNQQAVSAQQTVDFKWPTIKPITFTPANGTVPGDGTTPYQFTAEIIGVDDTKPYTGQYIEFEWVLKLPEGVDESKTKLSPPPDKPLKVEKGGTLQASLVSGQFPVLKGAQVCLQVVNEPSTQQCSEAVNFKEVEKITVKLDQPGPLLVNETYTYTATITGAPEAGSSVNWGLEKDGQPVQHIPGVTLKRIEPDDIQKGQSRATLTSSKAISGLVVTASIGNSKPMPAPAPVEFKWPTIKQPTTTQGNKSVPGDGGGAYQFTADVFGADGTTPYTGKGIAFEWVVKHPDPKNPNNDETTLSTPPGSPITEVKGGTLATSLTSYQYPAVQGAEVCLQVAGAPSTQQCSNPVDFQEVDLTLQIESVVVSGKVVNGTVSKITPDDLPLVGDGYHEYRYQATITRTVNQNIQGGTVPFKNQNFMNIPVNWQRNSEISRNVFPDPTPELDGSGYSNTDQNGYLYARLKSTVGVNKKVSVILNLNEDQDNWTYKTTDEDNDVSFAPALKQGQLYIYNYNQNRYSSTYGQINKHNRFKDSNHPSNFFPQLSADVLDYESDDVYQNINERPNIVYKIDSSSSPDFIDLGKNREGPLSFTGKGSALVYAKHTKSDGQVNIYYYDIQTDRIIYYPASEKGQEYSPTDGNTCEDIPPDSNGVKLITINVADFKGSSGLGKARPILDEFSNVFDWGVFDANSGDDIWGDLNAIKIYDTATNQYVIYDTKENNITNSKNSGLLLCTLSK
ncbi:hypothetical protein, partial [Xenorhabdus santafensis]|uniref:hypothetical protein n=1 Tax=Xenorhabdus santafensis TaxID=2582833 RepID=UPI0029E7F9F6